MELSLLRSLDERDGRVQHIAVEDDEADAEGNGERHVSMHVSIRHPGDVDRILEEMGRRPENLAVRIGAGETD